MSTEIALLPDEAKNLAQYEAVIERGLTTFYEVGAALNAIKLARLYRANYATFDAYCAEKWGIGKSRVYQMTDAVKVVDTLKTSTTVEVLPESERQVRPLTTLEPEQQAEAWNQAVEDAGSHQPTGTQVRAAVQSVQSSQGIQHPPSPAALLAASPSLNLPSYDPEDNSLKHYDPEDSGPEDNSPEGDDSSKATSADDDEMTDAEKIARFDAFVREMVGESGLDPGGMLRDSGSSRCVLGCRVAWYKPLGRYVHDDDCVCGQALDALGE